jgi:hypothetical protein
MSREFGEYERGYFHQKIASCANDCKGGRDQLTKLWGKFLEEFSHVAHEISNSEACDAGPDAPIIESIKRLPRLRELFMDVQKYLTPYDACMREAIKMHIDGHLQKDAANEKSFWDF